MFLIDFFGDKFQKPDTETNEGSQTTAVNKPSVPKKLDFIVILNGYTLVFAKDFWK